MTDIPFHIKMLAMLGAVKVKPIDSQNLKTSPIKNTSVKGKKTIKLKATTIFALVPVFIMVSIPIMILVNSNTPL